VERIIIQINTARAQAGLPLLVFDPFEPVEVSVHEENNPRGPGGLSLANRLPNQEIEFSIFAELPGALNGEVVVFLTDALRSNSELADKGIPGAAAVFQRSMGSVLSGSNSLTNTTWVASNATDRIEFSATYSSAAIAFRSRFPGATAYLNCNLGYLVDILFRSLPNDTFKTLDRSQSAVVTDFTRSDVRVRLRVKHHDPDIQAIFNDPQNAPSLLIEFDRILRQER